jgi:ribosomal protein L20
MQIIETRAISLQAPQDVKLSAGLTLPPGQYRGTEERIRADSIGGPSWFVNYKITLTEQQLASIDPDLSSANMSAMGHKRTFMVQSRHFAKQSACPLWLCRSEPACAGTKVAYSEFVANLRRLRTDAVKTVVTHLGTSHLGDHFSAGVSELHARFRLCQSLVMQKI